MVGYGDVKFGSSGGAVENGVTGFGDICCEAVSTAILYSGIDGLANASRGCGEIADVIRELHGRDW